MKFLVTGGSQRSNAVWKDEWKHYEVAKLCAVNWTQGTAETALEYISPSDCVANKDAAIVFKAGSLINDLYYACTQTEVLIYSFPSLKLIKRLSLPFFNDVHHVTLFNGALAVVSSGLDMVILFDEDYQPKHFYNTLGKDPWHKFSKQTDYRKILTTKPHQSHPNYAFQIDDELWSTRFEQKDAVCLNDISKRININAERVHDGIAYGDYVYFTTVNGMVFVANKYNYAIEEIYDLNEAYESPNPLGWCRGLHVEDDRLFIGFSALRSTKTRENLAWIKRGFKGSVIEMRAMKTRIVEYNPLKRAITKEINLSDAGLDAIFSIHKF